MIKKQGRPVGSKTTERAVAISLPPACPACNSTNREAYKDGIVDERNIAGDIDGRPYNRVVWRRTRCIDCGQNLTVREYHYDPDPATDADDGEEQAVC